MSGCLRCASVCLDRPHCHAKKVVSLLIGHSFDGQIVPPLVLPLLLNTFLHLGDTILEEPQRTATTSNRRSLPPPPRAQQDRETRGPPKVIKSHDQRIGGDIHTSFTCSTASSHKLHHKQQFYHRLPMDVVSLIHVIHSFDSLDYYINI